MPRQIGWSQESNLLYNISMQLDRLAAVTAAAGGGGTITGSGTAGQVTYWSGASAVSGSNNLFWDAANGRLGVNNAAPSNSLDVTGTGRITGQTILATSVGANVGIGVTPSAWVSTAKAIEFGGSAGNYLAFNSSAQEGYLYNNVYFNGTNNIYLRNGRALAYGLASGSHIWYNSATGTAGNVVSFTQAMTLFSTGNLGIGTGNSDSGQRLQVTGDTLLKGSGNTSGTTALTVQNSDGSSLLRVINNGLFRIGNAGVTGTAILPFSSDQSTVDINGYSLSFFGYDAGNAKPNGFINITGQSFTATSGTQYNVVLSRTFTPASGNANFASLVINPSIGQTGGANGITRGIYVNPTLTAAADWRSIEWSNNTGWGLYGAGSANNYLGGRLGIGSTSLGDVNLRIAGTISGSTGPLAVVADGTISSTSTGSGYFFTTARTQAAAFTINDLQHYTANSAAFGAGSTVTNQYGFIALSTLTGATNNYGFYGNIPSATGRWNLYMNGTAANYMNGELLLGSTTNTGEKLQVTGTARINGSLVFTNGNGIISTTGSYKYFEFYDSGSATNSYLIAHASVGEHQFGFGTNSGSIAGSAFYNMVLSRTGLMLRDTLSTTSTSVASAVFDLRSTTRGFLPPRMTTTQKNAISSPAAGLVVYDTTLAKLCVYTTAWETITSA